MRTNTWSNIGTEHSTKDYKELLSASDLNYTTVARDLYTDYKGQRLQVPNKKVLMREDTQDIFGIVSDKYQICQNVEALDFVDCIDDVELQRAGQIGGLVWMIGKLPETKVLGDTISPHLIFQNSHDGSCSIKTTICMLRIICQNQFISTFKDSPATISIRHNGDLDGKLKTARATMKNVYEYIKNYNTIAEDLASKRVTSKDLDNIIEEYFKIPDDASQRSINNILDRRDAFYSAYNAEDNQNFTGTKWGIINAFADFTTHEEFSRKTSNWETNRFLYSLSPSTMDNFMKLVEAA